MIKSYLINLDKDSERLGSFKRQFERLNIEFERIPAVDGRQVSEAVYTEFQRARPRNHKKGWLRGQMGCFLSHYAAWQIIANGDEPFGAVFEDDIYISDGLGIVLSSGAWIPEGVDIVRLEPSTNRIRLGQRKVLAREGRDYFQVLSTSWCAGAYLLSRSAARRLIEIRPEQHQPADIMLFSFEDSAVAPDLTILQCQPALCIQDKFLNPENQTFRSNIEGHKRKPGSGTALNHLSIQRIAGAIYRLFLNYKRVRYR